MAFQIKKTENQEDMEQQRKPHTETNKVGKI